MKFKVNFEIGKDNFSREFEMADDQVKQAMASKIYRTAQVLKNTYNANIESKAKLEKLLENDNSINMLELATNAKYRKETVEKASKIQLEVEPEEKTEIDFIDQSIEKVSEGGGQND